MIQLIINNDDIYRIDDTQYFKFQYENAVYRDVNIDISKNNKYILEIIAKKCELNYKGLKKNELVNLILNSNCLVIN